MRNVLRSLSELKAKAETLRQEKSNLFGQLKLALGTCRLNPDDEAPYQLPGVHDTDRSRSTDVLF